MIVGGHKKKSDFYAKTIQVYEGSLLEIKYFLHYLVWSVCLKINKLTLCNNIGITYADPGFVTHPVCRNIFIFLWNNCTNKFQTNLWVLWYTLWSHSLRMCRFQGRSCPCWDINTELICVYIFACMYSMSSCEWQIMRNLGHGEFSDHIMTA